MFNMKVIFINLIIVLIQSVLIDTTAGVQSRDIDPPDTDSVFLIKTLHYIYIYIHINII